jgi:hypothetical protein
MPKQIDRGPAHVYPAAVAQRRAGLLAAYLLTAPPVTDAGSPQRRMFARHPVNSTRQDATPQRLAVLPSMEYPGWTRPAQRVTTAPSLANTDAPVPGLISNPNPAGIPAAILPAGTRLPVV